MSGLTRNGRGGGRSALLVLAVVVLGAAKPPEPWQGPVPAALYVSTRGDDHADGRAPDRSLRTIAAALARAGPAVTIYVEGGRYFEQLVTRRAGTRGGEITVTSYNGAAVIDGSALPWAPASDQNQALVELRHPFVRLVGLDVAHSKNTGILLAADDLSVEGCRIRDIRLHAVSADTSRQTKAEPGGGTMIRRVLIKGNVIERAALSGNSQVISLIADGFSVIDNTVRNSPKEGIDIWLGSRRGDVVGNTVYGNGAAGIYVDGAAYVTIRGNIVYGNRSGIGLSSEDTNYGTHDVWVFNNIVYDNRDAGFFLWDNERQPGQEGVQNVVIAHNTIVRNKNAFYLAGEGNTVRILNNLGYSAGSAVQNDAVRSSLEIRGNVWLHKVTGFVSAERPDFRLKAGSPAIDKGVSLPMMTRPGGDRIGIAQDFDSRERPAGSKPDAGAFEYTPAPGS